MLEATSCAASWGMRGGGGGRVRDDSEKYFLFFFNKRWCTYEKINWKILNIIPVFDVPPLEASQNDLRIQARPSMPGNEMTMRMWEKNNNNEKWGWWWRRKIWRENYKVSVVSSFVCVFSFSAFCHFHPHFSDRAKFTMKSSNYKFRFRALSLCCLIFMRVV